MLKDGVCYVGEDVPNSPKHLGIFFIVGFLCGHKDLSPSQESGKCPRWCNTISFCCRLLLLRSSRHNILLLRWTFHVLCIFVDTKPFFMGRYFLYNHRSEISVPILCVIADTVKVTKTVPVIKACLERSGSPLPFLLLLYATWSSPYHLPFKHHFSFVLSPVLVYSCYSTRHITEPHSKPPTIHLKPVRLDWSLQCSLFGIESAPQFFEPFLLFHRARRRPTSCSGAMINMSNDYITMQHQLLK